MPRRKSPKVDEEALASWWDEFGYAVQDEAWPRVEQLLRSLEVMPGVSRGELAYANGVAIWEREGGDAARETLAEAVRVEPGHADARHALALASEHAGDRDEMSRQFLAVLRLDAAADAEHQLETDSTRAFIANAAARVLDELPTEFRERLVNVPVVLESRPSLDLVAQGFDPRSLGLFEGNTDAEQQDAVVAPTRIVLYAANLLASFPHDDDLGDEVETTILHEVAHFFGLDENQVAELGLA